MQGDGASHRVGARVVQPGEQHLAHKYLLAFGDVESHVHLAGVRWFRLLLNLDLTWSKPRLR